AQVDLDRRDPQSEALASPREGRDLRAAEHDLRRHAPEVVALAAEQVALGERAPHIRSLSQLEGDLGAGPATPDHEDVEPLHHALGHALWAPHAPRKRTNTRA